MKQNTSFTIEDYEFQAPMDLLEAEFFEVRSAVQSYRVFWDSSLNALQNVNELMVGTKNLLLIDENVFKLYRYFLGEISDDRIFRAEATEDFKTLHGITAIYRFLEQNKFTKNEHLVVVGGGIIQDVAAFVGATYKRGITWYYFPTTLLAMCDSCIGGKASINHNNVKNQLGLFSAPARIIINTNFLDTLQYREIISGLGETLKLHIIGGHALLENYQEIVNEPAAIKPLDFKTIILGALAVKKAVIEVDEFDLSYRRALNYGHTIGHAVEVLSNFNIPHGQAIIIGMLVLNELSHRRGMLSIEETARLKKIMFKLLDPVVFEQFYVDGLQELLGKDKKSTGDHVNFAVLNSIGNLGFLRLRNDNVLFGEIKGIIGYFEGERK